MAVSTLPVPAPGLGARLGGIVRRAFSVLAQLLVRLRIVQMFVADRPLAIATGFCAAVSLAPLFMTTFLPLVDIGSNVGAAALLDDVAFGSGIVAQRFQVNWAPVPYWSGWAIMNLVDGVAGPYVAAKAIVALSVLLLPLSIMRLLMALGRSPRLGLWAFLLAWDTNLYWGWVTFQIGMPAGIWLLARLIETDSWKGAARLIPWSAFVALTHVHAVLLLGLTCVFQALVRPHRWRSLGQAVLALVGFAVLIPWVVSILFGGSSSSAGGELRFDFDTLPMRLKQFYRFTLDVMTSFGGETLTGLAFLTFIIGPAAVAALRPAPTAPRSGAQALVLPLTAAALYLTLPFAVSGPIVHWWTYPRYGTYALLGLLLLPTPDLRGWRTLALVPGLILVAGMSVARMQQFAAYDDRTRPYLRIINGMRANTSFLPLDLDLSWEGTRESSLGQLHGYAAAARSSYDPHLFDNKNTPLLYRSNVQPPAVDWTRVRDSFSLNNQGRYYDYIIVHPFENDPLAPYRGRGVEWERDAGEWRLYRVTKR